MSILFYTFILFLKCVNKENRTLAISVKCRLIQLAPLDQDDQVANGTMNVRLWHNVGQEEFT